MVRFEAGLGFSFLGLREEGLFSCFLLILLLYSNKMLHGALGTFLRHSEGFQKIGEESYEVFGVCL